MQENLHGLIDKLRFYALKFERQTFIGIGANLGDRIENCTRALDIINSVPGCSVSACSRWYETEPIGMESSNWFINGVACVDTELVPQEFMQLLLETEKRLGRVRSGSQDRTVDLDLLYYQGVVLGYEDDVLREDHEYYLLKKEKMLVVPHPAVPVRRFVLAPWSEIAPDLCVQPWGRTVSQMLDALEEDSSVVRLFNAGHELHHTAVV